MRGALTLLVIVLGLLVVWAVLIGSGKDKKPPPAPAPTPVQQVVEQPTAEPVKTPEPVAVEKPAAEPTSPTPPAPPQPVAAPATQPAVAASGLHAKPFHEARVPIIGSTSTASGYKLDADLSAWGASILSVHLTDYTRTVRREEQYTILASPIDPQTKRPLYPYAATSIWIGGEHVSLKDVRWELVGPVHYRTTADRSDADEAREVTGTAEFALTIVDDKDQPVVELRRTYTLDQDSYQIQCAQQIINRTSGPLDIQWEQRAQTGIKKDEITYMGDRRTFAAGYFNPDYDSARTLIFTDDAWIDRAKLLKSETNVWPYGEIDPSAEIIWLASLNRYFTLVTHPQIPAGTTQAPALDDIFADIRVSGHGEDLEPEKRVEAMVLRTAPFSLPTGQTRTLTVDLYAGPRQRVILETASNNTFELGQLIKYEMSSACAFCTFQWLAKGLVRFLDLIHAIVRDWSIAIIILVMVVRALLHPILKKSQVNMMVFQKQMAAIQPEIEKLKKKYPDDQQKVQQEQFKLMRERGVSFGGCLNFLPMFLQMPIWIALYAMLFFAIELRHEPAFYGVFQMMGGWGFLADLSSPDEFIRFTDREIRIPFLFLQSLDFAVLNILPILWTVVMYFQQKFTMPPATTDQQAQQQKIMKFMTFLFPIMLYSAPSGLTLYILVSTTAGMVDTYFVRKHVKEREERGDLGGPGPGGSPKPPRKPKPGGFMDRMQKAMETAQRRQQEQARGKGGGQKKKRHD